MYVVATINCKSKVLIKSRHETRKEAETAMEARKANLFGAAAWDANYLVLGPRQLKQKLQEFEEAKVARKKVGAKKASKKRAKNKAKGKKPNFILCPTCDARSKKLYSEMGGMQTRQCKNGHLFEVDTFFGFESTKRRIESAARSSIDSIDPSYMQRRYGSSYKKN